MGSGKTEAPCDATASCPPSCCDQPALGATSPCCGPTSDSPPAAGCACGSVSWGRRSLFIVVLLAAAAVVIHSRVTGPGARRTDTDVVPPLIAAGGGGETEAAAVMGEALASRASSSTATRVLGLFAEGGTGFAVVASDDQAAVVHIAQIVRATTEKLATRGVSTKMTVVKSSAPERDAIVRELALSSLPCVVCVGEAGTQTIEPPVTEEKLLRSLLSVSAYGAGSGSGSSCATGGCD